VLAPQTRARSGLRGRRAHMPAVLLSGNRQGAYPSFPSLSGGPTPNGYTPHPPPSTIPNVGG